MSRSVRKGNLSAADTLGRAAKIPTLHRDKPAPANDEKPPMKRVNFHVSAEKHRLLKAKAAASGKTMKQVLEAAIDRYLSE